MIYFWLALFMILICGFWILNFFGLPGNWLIVLTAAIWIWFGPEKFQFSWIVFFGLIAMALVGEAIEFLASVLGTQQFGGSKRSAALSVVGSVVGGILGAVLGVPIPIPIVGILIGSILFASIGAMAGAMIGEHYEGTHVSESMKIGSAAFVGRLLGTVGKITVGSAMVVLSIAAPFIF